MYNQKSLGVNQGTCQSFYKFLSNNTKNIIYPMFNKGY